MTDVNQMPSVPNVGPDQTFHNYGVTDIAAGTCVLFDTASGHDNGVVVPTTAGNKYPVCGITMEIIKAGKDGRVRRWGAAQTTASGAITRGDFVGIDSASSHEGQAIVAASHQQQLGQALDTAADGDPVRVDLRPANYT